jgi:two-component system response regulator RegX3
MRQEGEDPRRRCRGQDRRRQPDRTCRPSGACKLSGSLVPAVGSVDCRGLSVEQRRIVIVDDDPFAARMLTMVLRDAGYEVDIAHNGAAALTQVIGRQTGLVLLDVQLPDADGYTVLGELREGRYKGPIIVLSDRGELAAILEAFRHGADDYIRIPFEPLELLARIDAVLRSTASRVHGARSLRIQVDDAVLDLKALAYSSAAVETVPLAPTEMRLLDVLMRQAYVAIDRDTLNARIWGGDLIGDLNRVDVYVRRLRRKIEPDPERPRYLHTVRGLGYVFRPDSATTPRSPTIDGDAREAIPPIVAE